MIINASLINAFAQVYVDDSKSVVDLVKSLQGPGVQVSNVTYYSPTLGRNSIGYFSDSGKKIGLGSGLLLTSGSAKNAEPPNNTENKTQINGDNKDDPDLRTLIDPSDEVFDLCAVEFDIITTSENISFNYVFASDEYIEYPDYNDVFGFFISGPGIVGKKNLALIPGTSTPVSVKNIHPFYYRSETGQSFPASNQQYYINNPIGSRVTQYDGFTVVLSAKAKVRPCQTYHIKLAIEDLRDARYDSGVFIEQGSLKSEDIPNMKVFYQFPNYNFGVEGCNNARVLISRSTYISDTVNLTYILNIGGSATNGVDYIKIKDTVSMPSGTDSVWIYLNFIVDNIQEDQEITKISIKSNCPNFPDIAFVEVPIKDRMPYKIQAETICLNGSGTLNKTPDANKSIQWQNSPFLSCTDCLSPKAFPDTAQYFKYTITDTITGCSNDDSVFVKTLTVSADFDIHSDECYTSLDIFFTNKSQNAKRFTWSFGDNSTSIAENPSHLYEFKNSQEPMQFAVTLTAKSNNPECTADTTKIITIAHPLFIPNLITPNDDQKNDNFTIEGIGEGCWTVTIFNRWGNVVYKKNNYKNDFIGEGIEEGTYFYVLENSPKDREFKGWIHILSNKNSDR